MDRLRQQILQNLPSDWLRLTTHRLDIYNESLAKTEFLEKLQSLNEISKDSLSELPTAFDYIRLGHPLSCVLEWEQARDLGIKAESVISFSSQTMPIMAVLRRNKLQNIKTRIAYKDLLPVNFDEKLIKEVYQYDFELVKVDNYHDLKKVDGCTITINSQEKTNAQININLYENMGSVIQVLDDNSDYIKEIQHVRRRESIAMTPHNCLKLLKGEKPHSHVDSGKLNQTIQKITRVKNPVSLGSCGLSVQYAIMMGLVHHANDHHPGRDIKFIVPPNCYGGTNDQARRVAACIDNVEIVDLPVDSGKDMVSELDRILKEVETLNAIPYIIAEIPTNPRVEIPDLIKLAEVLKGPTNPVFILDQTFCPNVEFFGDGGYLNEVRAISYVSGSKFPSGGLCTAGYSVANDKASEYVEYVNKHLLLCDNTATDLQVEILTEEMPSMNDRIAKAYKNTRAFVDHIQTTLPEAKINFVSHELANATFTPSVFSLDLPTKGNSHEEREEYKRKLNHKLIQMMIDAIPEESKHCVSYGQLKGCYWTIPATSTQGTTKESDKDYIVRVSIAADFNLEKHKEVFTKFCSEL
ncbi:MAG: cystathionine beta-synthase [Oligoflexia bacterium]|nr:cystathionine beta-synthase [Oligoflexia bacterium]